MNQLISKVFFFKIIVFVFLGCIRSKEIVTEVDASHYFDKIKPGITQDSMRSIMHEIQSEIEANTLNKKLPNVNVFDAQGKRHKLSKFAKDSTIINFSNAHCGFGLVATETDLPKAIEEVSYKKALNCICILFKTEQDVEDSKEFEYLLNSVSTKYDKVLIISDSVAQRINVTASPTRMYLDDKMVVYDLIRGHSLEPNTLTREIKRNYSIE